MIVDDVNADPNYLACFLETRAEIVVPVRLEGAVVGEIDIDGNSVRAFDASDRQFLERRREARRSGRALGCRTAARVSPRVIAASASARAACRSNGTNRAAGTRRGAVARSSRAREGPAEPHRRSAGRRSGSSGREGSGRSRSPVSRALSAPRRGRRPREEPGIRPRPRSPAGRPSPGRTGARDRRGGVHAQDLRYPGGLQCLLDLPRPCAGAVEQVHLDGQSGDGTGEGGDLVAARAATLPLTLTTGRRAASSHSAAARSARRAPGVVRSPRK